jgi:SP family arabinose:H+ symporter-like MFS transporter
VNHADRPPLPERGNLCYFTAVCFAAGLGGLLFGFDTAVISGANGFLLKQFQLSAGMQGWVVSSALVGCVVGSAIAGWLADRYGRKWMLVLSAVLFMVTALGSALAPSAGLLSVARLIGGIGVGVVAAVAPLYIAEISPPRLRGRMVALYQLAITLGVVGAYLTNAGFLELSIPQKAVAVEWYQSAIQWVVGWVSGGLHILCKHLLSADWYQWMVVREVWRIMVASLSLPAVVFFLWAIGVPESPRWLTEQGDESKALRILAHVGGRVEGERAMQEIRETIAQETGGLAELCRPRMLRLFGIAIFLAVSSQLCGINAIIYFGPSILEAANLTVGTALQFQVVVGIVAVVFTLLAIWKVDTMGRRPLLIVGSLGVMLSLAAIGLLFHLNVPGGLWLVLSISSFLAFFAFSLGPLAWIVMSEIFPLRVRGRAMSLATVCLWLANTLVCQTFPSLRDHLGLAGTFWIFSAMVLPIFLFSIKLMPETKGRSLEELEKSLFLAPQSR